MSHRRNDEPRGSRSKLDASRAVHPSSSQEIHSGTSVQPARSGASLRAERAYHHWTALPIAERPLEIGARAVADIFDRAMIAESLTNAAVGEHVGVEEKTVRQWRTGEKRLPAGVLVALPVELAARFIRAIAFAMGGR